MTQRHNASKHCWKNGASRLARCRVATNLQFVKNAVSAKPSKAKHNKTRYAFTVNAIRQTQNIGIIIIPKKRS